MATSSVFGSPSGPLPSAFSIEQTLGLIKLSPGGEGCTKPPVLPIIESVMIYNIYEKDNCVIETDSVDMVKAALQAYPGCTVKEAATGKVLNQSADSRR
jgi:hypothetical protein